MSDVGTGPSMCLPGRAYPQTISRWAAVKFHADDRRVDLVPYALMLWQCIGVGLHNELWLARKASHSVMEAVCGPPAVHDTPKSNNIPDVCCMYA